MDDERLDPSLLPAHALPEPVGELVRRFLAGVGLEAPDLVAVAREAYAEIGVLGHVPFVPPAGADQRIEAKMVGRAAKRNRQVERAQARIDQIEQDRIFDRKHRREPGVAGVADGEPRLKAVDVWLVCKARGREPELARRRLVLGVIDGEAIASGRRKREIERARLGRRLSRRRDDHLVARRQSQREDARQGLAVPPLDDELDVELALRIVEGVEGPDEVLDDFGFVVERRDHRIDRKLVVGEQRRPDRRAIGDRRHRPQHDRGEESEPATRGQGRIEQLKVGDPERESRGREQSRGRGLAEAHARSRGEARRQAAERVLEDRLPALHSDQ